MKLNEQPTSRLQNCKDRTAKCFRFNCTIYNLSPGVQGYVIRVRSRLWNSTFTEVSIFPATHPDRLPSHLIPGVLPQDYPDVNWVEITSNASIVIDEKFDISQDKSDDSLEVRSSSVLFEHVSNDSSRSSYDFQIITKVTPDLLKFPDRQKKSVPVWIIVVSVLAGMFLLAIVILLLIKVRSPLSSFAYLAIYSEVTMARPMSSIFSGLGGAHWEIV